MIAVITLLVAVLAVWLLGCLALIWAVQLFSERRQLNALAERLQAEARIDQLTRRSVQAMRDAVAQHHRPR